MADKDKYGIPSGGNNGLYTAKKWQGLNYTLTWDEVIACVALAGWKDTEWGTAAAVAAAESSRNPFIYNTYKKGHFGLFQISRSAHPEFFAPDGNGMQWVFPWLNAAEGHKIYQSQGWGAWAAKTNGAYLAYYPAAMEAAASVQRRMQLHGGDEKEWLKSLIRQKTAWQCATAAGVDVAGIGTTAIGDAIAAGAGATAQGTVDSGAAVASSVGDMAQVVTGLWSAITTPALWMRLGYGALGVVLVSGGLFLIVRNQPAVRQAASTVGSVVPAGRALKAVKGAA